MASITPGAAEANVFEDLSGNPISQSTNPYDALIIDCQNDPKQIQSRYETHRTARNRQQKAKLLSPSFSGFSLDPVLHKLVHKAQYPDFEDERNCLVFWARPPQPLKALIRTIQQRLLDVAPNLWLMPPDNLHMTTLEVAHSLTADEVSELVSTLAPSLPSITSHTHTHRARLLCPMISYDASALAISLLPAAASADGYTYHHLRRDIHALCTSAGVTIGSRYTVPSAHLTIARFVTQADTAKAPAPVGITAPAGITTQAGTTAPAETTEQAGTTGHAVIDTPKIKHLLDTIEALNAWLQREYWPRAGEAIKPGGEWIVGEEVGLDCRRGTLWYGGGETVTLGKGF